MSPGTPKQQVEVREYWIGTVSQFGSSRDTRSTSLTRRSLGSLPKAPLCLWRFSAGRLLLPWADHSRSSLARFRLPGPPTPHVYHSPASSGSSQGQQLVKSDQGPAKPWSGARSRSVKIIRVTVPCLPTSFRAFGGILQPRLPRQTLSQLLLGSSL